MSPTRKVSLDIIRDFLNFYDQKWTTSVFNAESPTDEDHSDRRTLLNLLGIPVTEESLKIPVLMGLVESLIFPEA